MTSVTSVDGVVIDVNQDNFTVKKDHQRWIIYHRLSFSLKPGDVVKLKGFVMTEDGYDLPHSFDFSVYKKGSGFDQSFFATDIEIIDHQFHLNQIKQGFQNYVLNIANQKTSAIILMLLFGDDTYVNDSLTNAINQMGISHLFAVSGMHIGLLIMMVKKLLLRLHVTHLFEDIIILFLLIIYSFLCGFSISVLRASALIILIFINKKSNAIFSKLDLLTFIMIVFLILNPFSIHLIAFQLSFLITFSILLANQMLNSKNELLGYFQLSVLSTAIGLPIILELNGGLNLLVIPMSIFFGLFVAKIILPGMFISILISFLMPLYQWVTNIFIEGIMIANSISSFIHFNFPSSMIKAMYWVVLFLCLSHSMSKKRMIFATFSFLFIIIVSFSVNHVPSTAYIRMLDVGQGDAIHLHDSKCDMLIDTGNIDKFDRLIEYFSKSNIFTLDYLILSHQHDDHIGETEDILNDLNINTLITNSKSFDYLSQRIINPTNNMSFSCGNFNMNIIYSDDSQPEENNNSVVLTVEIYNHKWLFTGDTESIIENQLDFDLIGEVDVIKVAHHGSITSSSLTVMENITPQYALISVGRNNRYGHPDDQIVKRWETNGAQVLRTDELGTIEFLYLQQSTVPFISLSSNQNKPYNYIKRIQPFLDWLIKSLFYMI